MQSDPIGLDGGINSYKYSNNSPLNYFDSNGKLFQWLSDLFVPTITFSRAELPHVSLTIITGFGKGHPNVLTKCSLCATTNRRAAFKAASIGGSANELARFLGWVGNWSWDEYPFASTNEGGAGAVVLPVPARENSVQGGKLSVFYRQNSLQDGDRFKVNVK